MTDSQERDEPARSSAFVYAKVSRKVWMSGDRYTILVDSAASNGSMTLIDGLVPPGGGPPVHVHLDKDELLAVVEGTVDIVVEGDERRVSAGNCAFVPRGVAHAFTNKAATPARVLLFFTPGGIEEFFLAAGVPATDGEAPPPSTPESVAREVAVAAKFQTVPPTKRSDDVGSWDVIGDRAS